MHPVSLHPRLWTLALGVALSLSAATNLSAKSQILRVGRLSVAKEVRTPELLRYFRTEMNRQVAKLPLRGQKKSAVISAAVVRLETKRVGRTNKATCVISATLQRPSSGAILAILKGKATATDSRDVSAARTVALEAAVHSTLEPVPNVLR